MTAGVHHAEMSRCEWQPGFFRDRQRVHVGPQRDEAVLGGSGQFRDQTDASNSAAKRNSEPAQFGRDLLGGAVFLVAQLGVLMQIAPNRHHPLKDRWRH
jgi:hypothetical protein